MRRFPFSESLLGLPALIVFGLILAFGVQEKVGAQKSETSKKNVDGPSGNGNTGSSSEAKKWKVARPVKASVPYRFQVSEQNQVCLGRLCFFGRPFVVTKYGDKVCQIKFADRLIEVERKYLEPVDISGYPKSNNGNREHELFRKKVHGIREGTIAIRNGKVVSELVIGLEYTVGVSKGDYLYLPKVKGWVLRDSVCPIATSKKYLQKRQLEDPSDQNKLNLALFILRQSNHKESMLLFGELIDKNIQNPMPYFHRAIWHKFNANHSKAMADFQKLVKLDPGNLDSKVFYSESCYQVKLFQKAIESCRDVLKVDPENLWAMKVLADSLERSGKTKSAIDHYKKYLLLKPDADVAISLAYALLKLEKYDDSLVWLHVALTLDPGNSTAIRYRGFCYRKTKKFKAAIKDFSLLIDGKSTVPEYDYLGRANCYHAIGEYRKTVDDLTSFLKIKPDRLDILEYRANLFLKLKDWDQAEEDIADLQEEVPSDGFYWALKGVIFQNKKEFQKAKDAFDKAWKLSKDDDRTAYTVAWFYATCPSKKIRDPELALKKLEGVSKDKHSRMRNELIQCVFLASKGNFDKAIENLKELNKKDNFNSQLMKEVEKAFRSKTPFVEHGEVSSLYFNFFESS